MTTVLRKRFAILTGIALFIAAIVALVAVAQIPKPVLDDGLGPRLTPALVSAFLLVLAFGFTQAAWQGRIPDVVNDPEEAPLPGGKLRVGWLVGGLILMMVLLPYLGIGIAATVAFVLFARAFDSRLLWKEVLIGFLFIFVCWLLFDRGLGVQLGGLIKFGELFRLG